MSTKKLQIIDSLIKEAQNADTLDGKHADEFALVTDIPSDSHINSLIDAKLASITNAEEVAF